jgi:hypothetical protein
MTTHSEYRRSAEDTLAILDVVGRYGFVVDDRDWEGFEQVFTEDAVFDARDHDHDPPRGFAPIEGRQEIVRAFRDLYIHPTQHMIVTSIINDISPDEVIVRSKGMFPIPEFQFFEGVYTDVVVRTAIGWRIRNKTFKRFGQGSTPWMRESVREALRKGATLQ